MPTPYKETYEKFLRNMEKFSSSYGTKADFEALFERTLILNIPEISIRYYEYTADAIIKQNSKSRISAQNRRIGKIMQLARKDME